MGDILQSLPESSLDMTVEEFLKKECEKQCQRIETHTQQIICDLRQQFEDCKQELVRSLEASEQTMKNTLGTIEKGCYFASFRVEDGPHTGESFKITVFEGIPTFVGRSTGEKFVEKGISLHLDPEISTTHARIRIQKGQLFIFDARSTNGTSVDDQDISQGASAPLQEGSVIVMGQTKMICTQLEAKSS